MKPTNGVYTATMRSTISRLIFLFLLTLIGSIAKGNDSVYIGWVTRYSGPGNAFDFTEDLAVDQTGNIYVTGFSDSPEGSAEYATVKYDASGAEQWIARYGGTSDLQDVAKALAIDGQGNVVVAGTSIDAVTFMDFATIKYDASGVEQWVARYDGPMDSGESVEALVVDDSGNVYVTGYGDVPGAYEDYITIKYDVFGVQQWVALYDGGYLDYAKAITVDDMGNVYVTGGSGDPTNFYADWATIKYDASGNEQWVARYAGPGNSADFAIAIAVDDSGNVYVGGYSFALGTLDDYLTIKYDNSGAEQWEAHYNHPSNSYDEVNALAIDNWGNVYVTGKAGPDPQNDIATIKYDVNGVEQWIAHYNGPANLEDEAGSIAVDGLGNVYVAGLSEGFDGEADYLTIKYSPLGIERWVVRHSGSEGFLDVAKDLAVDDSGNVWVTGWSDDLIANADYLTIKYQQTLPPPYRVLLSMPEDGAIVSDESAVCEWSSGSPEVDRYWFEWSVDSSFAHSQIDSTNQDTVSVATPLQSGQTYWWRVRAHNDAGWGQFSEVWSFSVLITGVEAGKTIPAAFSLSQNYPEPFNPSTTISFSIPRPGEVSLTIFNLLGEEVATLVSGNRDAGTHTVQWNATGQPSGVYFYKITAGTFTDVKKLVVVK